MRSLVLITSLLLVSVPATAQDVYVDGYTRNDGTYVQPYNRSAPNDTTYDNYESSPRSGHWDNTGRSVSHDFEVAPQQPQTQPGINNRDSGANIPLHDSYGYQPY